MLESNVFSRTEIDGDIVSDSTYNAVIGVVLCWGFLVNWLIVKYVDTATLVGIDFRLFLLGYFASCFLGVYLFNSSKDPAVSFVGYNFVVVPFGLVVNMIVSRYEPALVLEAIRITAMVTITMMSLGAAFPKFFEKIHTTLAIALLAVIIIELVQIFILHIETTWTDWIVVTIFCGYIGYDWGRANQIPKTVDNAVDSAAAIYMDIINLFIRILRILGRKKS